MLFLDKIFVSSLSVLSELLASELVKDDMQYPFG
jgi:hypothetical protein